MDQPDSRIRPYALEADEGWTYRFGIDFIVKAGEVREGGARCPVQKAVVAAGAAHVREIALTVAIYRGSEAQFDQVRNRGEVAENVERPQVRMLLGFEGDGNGSHHGEL